MALKPTGAAAVCPPVGDVHTGVQCLWNGSVSAEMGRNVEGGGVGQPRLRGGGSGVSSCLVSPACGQRRAVRSSSACTWRARSSESCGDLARNPAPLLQSPVNLSLHVPLVRANCMPLQLPLIKIK